MIILGLDMSSTCIGYATADGEHRGHVDLKGDIAARCRDGAALVTTLLDTLRPALVVIESPVARFAKAVIPQARVSGAVLAVFADNSTLWTEVTPQAGKMALCGDAGATKQEMVEAGRRALKLSGITMRRNGKWALWMDGRFHFTEDEADAYGLALAGRAVRVEVAA